MMEEGRQPDLEGTGDVGDCLRRLRVDQGYSLRALADLSGVAVNTLSLIENGKVSPSVGTLQRVASTLGVPMTALFESEPPHRHLVHRRAADGPSVPFSHGALQELGAGMADRAIEPFEITLDPHADSGPTAIVHTGQEFVYCLEGRIEYIVDDHPYELGPGDSLLFEAHLPHRWVNTGAESSRAILVLCPLGGWHGLTARHFGMVGSGWRRPGVDAVRRVRQTVTARPDGNPPGNTHGGAMKIAVVTEDGKTISQHFGRAPYYLVATVEAGRIVDRQLRDKLGHMQFAHEPHEEDPPGQPHGTRPSAEGRHARMAQAITDCEALICGGMGYGAYTSMQSRGIRPVVTDLESVEEALVAYVEGRLVDQTDRLH